ncbi:MAG: plasmid stabilization protein [Rhizobiales bacterium]|nr:plasmid stabilization protein [Hyphomicrobiales bacterium]
MSNATESITVRGLEAGTKKKLRLRAAEHGHSMEEEVRTILRKAVSDERETDLATAIRRRVAKYGGIELALPPREPVRDPPDFSGPEYDPK